MSILQIKIVDLATNSEVVRDMTDAELKQVETDKAQAAQRQSDREAKAAVKASALAKLAALGLSADEIASL
jgi:hypothetical protein